MSSVLRFTLVAAASLTCCGCADLLTGLLNEQLAQSQGQQVVEPTVTADSPDDVAQPAASGQAPAEGGGEYAASDAYHALEPPETLSFDAAPTRPPNEQSLQNRDFPVDEAASLPALRPAGADRPAGAPAGGSQYDRPPPAAATETARPSLHLSTGVALAQSLPTGTAMGFSVRYQFQGLSPNSQARYLWVIRSPQGQVWQSPVQLRASGTLQTFVPEWGPVTGTYEMQIDEVDRYGRRTISKKLPAVYNL